MAKSKLVELSMREFELITRVKEGLSNKAIGDKMSISPRTVKAHLSHIFKKFGIREDETINRRVVLINKMAKPGWCVR